LVLALPRGGVPVGYEIAIALALPLDVVVVRKVGAPGDPEYGLGAVTEGGELFLDEPRVRQMGLRRSDLDAVILREKEEAVRRSVLYRGARPPMPVEGKVVVLVDDGVATGGTLIAAARLLRRRNPRRLVIATGVSPPETARRLRREADDVECLLIPEEFFSVGSFYRSFEPVEDNEVIELLDAAAGGRSTRTPVTP
jgi:putative phosphoribosyl transferase